jgi:DNA-binding MarR family transcriptional regulator
MTEPSQATPRGQALDRLARAAYSLSAADSRLRGRATRIAGAISLTHARAMRALADQGPLAIAQLATATETTNAAATQLVNGLVRAGYVTRERSANDQRSGVVALTAAGLQRHRDRQTALVRALEVAFVEHDITALDAATDVLRRLVGIYDQL